MKNIVFLLFLFATHLVRAQDESLIWYRIKSVMQAKQEILAKVWPSAHDTAYSIPFIYYTDTSSYIVNPPTGFVQRYKPVLKLKEAGLTVWQTKQRMDDLPFHMEVRVSDVLEDFNYHFPYGKISAIETVQRFTNADVPAWTGMVLHELFHGYQFRHQPFWEHAFQSKLIFSAINDSLQNYYKKQAWFKKSVDAENALLLNAIGEKNKEKRKQLVRQMLKLRDGRRKEAMARFNRPIEFYEKAFETMEGTARYIEASVIMGFHRLTVSEALKKLDPAYDKIMAAPEPEWIYKTEVSDSYTYVTGYNLVRLLNTFGSDYQSRLFKTPALTLEDIVREEAAK